jgi:hypothetical protein
LAEPPAPTAEQREAKALVEKELVRPLEKAESRRSRFSRAAPVARERRVRVLDSVAQVDVRGKGFVRFAIDVRRPWDEKDTWEQADLQGCAYVAEGKVFVQRGAAYLPARSAVGAQEKAVADVCRAAPQLAAVAGTAQ